MNVPRARARARALVLCVFPTFTRCTLNKRGPSRRLDWSFSKSEYTLTTHTHTHVDGWLLYLFQQSDIVAPSDALDHTNSARQSKRVPITADSGTNPLDMAGLSVAVASADTQVKSKTQLRRRRCGAYVLAYALLVFVLFFVLQ